MRGKKEYFHSISSDMEDFEISISIRRLSSYLYKYYHKKVIILLDEYDTPMQESYVSGYWEDLTFLPEIYLMQLLKIIRIWNVQL